MLAAYDERGKRCPAAHVQQPDALGAVELVRRKRQQIHPEVIDVERNATGRLHSVAVKDRLMLVGDARQGRDRLQRPELVVGKHHRGKHRPCSERRFEVGRIERAVFVDG